MKQYRYTSADFAPQDSHIPDAFMEDSELARIKQLAGVAKPELLKEYSTGESNPAQHTPNDNDMPTPSAVGSIAPTNNTTKKSIEKQLNIKTGTPEWFRLWFAKPELTGEKPVGDDKPDAEENPRYLLDKHGQGDTDKLSALSDELDKKSEEL